MNIKPKIFLFVHAVNFFLSFFVIIPMGMISTELNGHCLLYAKGNVSLNQQTNQSVFHLMEWGGSSNCNYVLVVGIVLFLTSAGFIWNYSTLVWKEHDKAPFGSFITMVINSVITFSTFIAALILSVGFERFCEDIVKSGQSLTCSVANFDLPSPTGNINSDGFFTRIRVGEFGIWCGLLTSLLTSMLAFCKVYYYHKNDDLLQALAVEKETLLNRKRRYQPLDGENTALKV